MQGTVVEEGRLKSLRKEVNDQANLIRLLR